MASSYPGALDSLPNPTSTTPLDSSTAGLAHHTQHANANDAIEAIQATLGVNPQGSEATVAARIAAVEAAIPSVGSLTLAAVTLTSVTQSSVYAGTTAGSTSNLTDGSGTTGTGTDSAIDAHVTVSWSGLKLITAVRLGGGSIAGFGNTSSYVAFGSTVRVMEYYDGSNWKPWIDANPAGLFVADTGRLQFLTIPGPPVYASAMRVRAVNNNYVAMTEFVPLELKLA